MTKSVVYAIRNLVNGKKYIGSSADFSRRKAKHLSMLRSGRHHSSVLQRAWGKYGEGNFIFEPLEDVEPTYQALKDREQHYLDTLKPEYNINDIADGHFRLGKRNSPEHRAKISASNMGRPGSNKGRRFSNEHCRKLSESHKGKGGRPVGYHHSTLSIEKMRVKALARTPRVQSPEERAKRVEQMKARWKVLTAEQLAEISRKISEKQRQPDRQTECKVCHTFFSYRPAGLNKPKTCSKSCLAELLRMNLKQRTDADPEANRRASIKRWSNCTPEQRKTFGRAVGLKLRKPDIEEVCSVCGQHFTHRPIGKQTRKACGSVCLSQLRKRLIASRISADPNMQRRNAEMRWNQPSSSPSGL